jgi:hypothetical protein
MKLTDIRITVSSGEGMSKKALDSCMKAVEEYTEEVEGFAEDKFRILSSFINILAQMQKEGKLPEDLEFEIDF